tara:strand:- start:33 stop:257 length:225 start_codon:yes stop_codon:yes gene_type:complete
LKTYIVTVDIKQSHTYEVKANSEAEAYEKIDTAELYEPSKPVSFDDGSAIPGVTYGDCEIWKHDTWTLVREVGA